MRDVAEKAILEPSAGAPGLRCAHEPAGNGGRGTGTATPAPLRVFTNEALARLRLRHEPSTAGEAEMAGPWRVVRLTAGEFGVFRRGDEEAGEPPFAVLGDRQRALLVAAALPGVGHPEVFKIHPESSDDGFPILHMGSAVGALSVFYADLAPTLDGLEAVLRSPTALALLLEAAGATALGLAGRALGLRLAASPTEEEA